jgi:hypothetical protein
MIIEVGNRRAAIHLDVESARYAVDHETRQAECVSGNPLTGEKRAVVEVHHRVGGNPQRALLGALLTPGPTDELDVVVGLSGAITNGATPSCPGSLGRDLVPGLPDEFGSAVIETLSSALQIPGVLAVDRAAYDEVESSSRMFGVAAAVLAAVLGCQSVDQVDDAVRRQLATWQ